MKRNSGEDGDISSLIRSLVVPSSSSDLLPYPFDNYDSRPFDESLLLFLKWDLLTTWVVRVFPFLNFS